MFIKNLLIYIYILIMNTNTTIIPIKDFATTKTSEFSSTQPGHTKNIFNVLREQLPEYINFKTILDATANIGVDTIHFAVNTQANITAVELNKSEYFPLKSNIYKFKLQNKIKAFNKNIYDYLKENNPTVDMIYFDPPWGGREYYKTNKLMLYLNDGTKNQPIYHIVNQIFANKNANVILMKLPFNFDYDTLQKNLDLGITFTRHSIEYRNGHSKPLSVIIIKRTSIKALTDKGLECPLDPFLARHGLPQVGEGLRDGTSLIDYRHVAYAIGLESTKPQQELLKEMESFWDLVIEYKSSINVCKILSILNWNIKLCPEKGADFRNNIYNILNLKSNNKECLSSIEYFYDKFLLVPIINQRIFLIEMIEYFEKNYNNIYWYEICSNKDDFPYKKYLMNEKDLKLKFAELSKYEPIFEHANYRVYNITFLKNFLYKNKPTILVKKYSDYENYNLLSDYFQEECRMKSKRYDQELSPFDYWNVNKYDIYNQSLKKYGDIELHSLRETIYEMVAECTSFRPTIMVSMIKLFKSRVILDFSSGWGDRLIGAMACDNIIDFYCGVDPNSCLHPNYKRMIEFFEKDATKYVMINEPFETAIIPDKKYDLIMTSPPYYNLESYSDEETQSTFTWKNLNDWLNNFLFASITKSWRVLQKGGHLVLSINDMHNSHKYVEKMIEFINSFSDALYLGVISCAEKQGQYKFKSPQPLWIWEKNKGRA